MLSSARLGNLLARRIQIHRLVAHPCQRIASYTSVTIMPKRKRSNVALATPDLNGTGEMPPPPLPALNRKTSRQQPPSPLLNPDENPQVIDAPSAHRASPDCEPQDLKLTNGTEDSDSPLSEAPEEVEPPAAAKKKKSAPKKAVTTPIKDDKLDHMVATASARRTALKEAKAASGSKDEARDDPEADMDDEEADPGEIKEALSRPPPVNSDYLPLPWKGRLGYACLNTYLRYSDPPVFSSRTTRIASILEHRHPIKDPSQPEHATKNRPDKDKPADVRLGQRFIEQLCLANVKDMVKMLRWNDKYNIKFLRLSSEAFPFASHAEYGYKLAPFAADALAEVGKVVAELGHRVTTHPGQFTQLGSPRESVIEASIRDLEYHDEMLSLLKLPPQQDRDAVMVLHMGGMFGDKEATIQRFKENYVRLPQSIKNRLVLENDDMCWGVHDILPVCQEMNIPMVLDFHHNNIIFDKDKISEGSKDIMDWFPAIRETWTKKGITQKMHYSEPTPPAITPQQRRKHNPRVASLPPCAPDMDLMIEAKDKEQAVFELMRTFKLPGFEKINDILPYIRRDNNKPLRLPKKKTPKKSKKAKDEDDEEGTVEEGDAAPVIIPEEEVGMGGPEGRVYWPPGMEEWLRPVKKVVKKKEPAAGGPPKPKTIEMLKAEKAKKHADAMSNGTDAEASSVKEEEIEEPAPTPTPKGRGRKKQKIENAPVVNGISLDLPNGTAKGIKKTAKKATKTSSARTKYEPTPETSDDAAEEAEALMAEDLDPPASIKRGNSRKSARAKPAKVSYKIDGSDDEL